MFDAYCRLLDRLCDDDDSWLDSDLHLLPSHFIQDLRRFNSTDAPFTPALLHSPFLSQAAARPDHPALVSQALSLSYGQLAERTARLASRLRRLGARPDHLVAVVMQKGWEQVVAVLGVLRAGAAYLPLSAELPRERLWELLGDAGVEVVLTQPWLAERLEWPAGVTCLSIAESEDATAEYDEVIAESDDAGDREHSPDSLAYVIYTSGSTGMPKGVMITHRAALNTVLDINSRFSVTHSDRILALSSLSFDLSVYDIFGTLAAGATVVIPRASERPDPSHWLELVADNRVTVWNSVPQLMEMAVEFGRGGSERAGQLSSLRLVMLSGDWIGLGLIDEVRTQAEGARVVSLGGATEASIWSIFYEVGEVSERWRSIPYGHPLSNQRFYVLNERMEECPRWVSGQLYIGGEGVAGGYWGDEEKSKKSFITHERSGERLYRTGDMGRFGGEGGEIEFLGREDGQVKVGGHRVEVGEVEAAIGEHGGVRECVVAGVGEARGDKRLVAYVVVNEGYRQQLGVTRESRDGEQAGQPGRITSTKQRLEFKLKHAGLRSEDDAAYIELDRPPLDESLIEAYYVQRRSYRKLLQRPIPFKQFSEFLSCLAQLKFENSPFVKYRYGSAGNLYPVQTYLYVKPERVEGLLAGTYYYHPGEHRLLSLSPGAQLNQEMHTAVNRAVFRDSAFSIFLVGQLNAITPMYGEVGKHYAAVEAGLMTQLLEMSAPASQVGLCQIGSLDFQSIRHLFKLDDDHVLLHSLVGGGIDPAQTKLPVLLQELDEYRAVIELFENQKAGSDDESVPVPVTLADSQPRHAVSVEASMTEELRSFLRAKLPEYMIPSTFVMLDALPLTVNGKVNRQALPAPDALRMETGYIAPVTEVERTIASILQEVLNLDKVGAQHNFFDLGGNSVHIIQVYNKLRERFETDFPIVAIFENPTISALAGYLSRKEGEQPSAQKETERGSKRKEIARRRHRQRRDSKETPSPEPTDTPDENVLVDSTQTNS
jgi:amino acid adenylation domain-containing protein